MMVLQLAENDIYIYADAMNLCHRFYPIAGFSPVSFAQASYPPEYFPTRYYIVSMQLMMILALLIVETEYGEERLHHSPR